MTTARRRPEGRYDEPRSLPRQLVVLLAVLLTLAVLTFGYAAYRHVVAHPTSASVVGFDVVADDRLVVRLEVRHDRSKRARCQLVAYDRDHATVGAQTVQVAPELADPATVTATVTTTARAFAVRVTACEP